MPNQTDSNRIGRIGERWFSNQLPSDWIIQKPSEDIGIDGNIVICEESDLNGVEFRVQIKSSGQLEYDKENIVLNGIKTTSFHYWLTGMSPTLLVAYDNTSGEGFFCWVNKFAAENRHLLDTKASTVTIKLPMTNRISNEGWTLIRKELSLYVGNIENTFRRARDMDLLIPTLRKLHECLNHLYTAHSAKPPENERSTEQYTFMCQYEIRIHIDFIKAIREFMQLVKVQKEAVDYFENMINSYITLVSECGIVGFEKVVEGDTKSLAIYHVPDFLRQGREKLFGKMIGVICTFTKTDDNE